MKRVSDFLTHRWISILTCDVTQQTTSMGKDVAARRVSALSMETLRHSC
jgi:hypothetical protein